jgi:hypothetical protein
VTNLHIDQLRSVYRLPSTLDAHDALRARLDAASGPALRAALDALLPATLTALGLPPDAEVAIQRLSIRLRIRGTDVSNTAISEAWAHAIAEALRTSLAPLAQRGGGVTPEVALFSSRFAAESACLLERFLGTAEAWWWRPLLGGDDPVPSSREILAGWIRATPERVPGALAELALEAPDGLALALSDEDARALVEAILSSRHQSLRALRDALRQPVSPPPRGLERGLPSGLTTAMLPEPIRVGGSADGDLLLDEQTLLRLLEPAETKAIDGARRPAAKRLLAICFLLARRPAAWTLLTPSAVRPDQRSVDAALDRGQASSELTAAALERSDTLSVEPATAQLRDRTTDIHRIQSNAVAPHEHRIGCGGLLFLIRRSAASSLLDEHRGAALEDRLVALGWLALHRALDPLPQGARRVAFERERPLLEVFSGIHDLPEELHLVPTGPAADDARAHLDAIAALLPAELDPCSDGLLATYGSEPQPFGPEHPHRALAHLLLRPGRVLLTRTHADLHLPARAVDVALRLGGWDIDPGFIPHLGRVIRFHYEER